MTEITIILKNNARIHFIATEKVEMESSKVLVYKADDGSIYTILADEIAASREKKIDGPISN